MYKFDNDIGYDQTSDALFNINKQSGANSIYTSLNTSSVWYQSGFNFSFVGGPHKLNGGVEEEEVRILHQPGMGANGWQGLAAAPGRNGCPINCDGDDRGVAWDWGSEPMTCNGESIIPSGNLVQSPRCYLIHPRIAIATQHYCPIYKQCGEMNETPDPYYIRFYHEIGADTDNPTSGYYDAQVSARRLIGAVEGHGGGCSLYDVGICDVPDGYKDVESPHPEVVSACAADQVLIVFTNPVPDFIRLVRLPTAEFMKKYTDEVSNPDIAQSGRILIDIDQYLRPLLKFGKIITTVHPHENGYVVNFGCNGTTVNVPLENNHLIWFSYESAAVGGEWFTDEFEKEAKWPYGSESQWGRFSRTNVGNNMGHILPSSDYIPTEKSLADIPYDYRDGRFGYSKWPGDSSSCTLITLNVGADGFRDLALLGWDIYNFRSALERICEEYELSYPNYVDVDYDFSAGSTPITERPSLGYKIYKSQTGVDGYYQDITRQAVPWEENHLDSDITGIPCVDPEVPCYIISENFIDDTAVPGQTYWYYITTLEDIGNGNYSESIPSEITEIVVPLDSEVVYSDDEKLFISRGSSREGILRTYSEPEYCTTEPVVLIDFPIVTGNVTKSIDAPSTSAIPLLGFTDPFNPPIQTNGEAPEPCLWIETKNDGAVDAGDANSYRPYPRDNTSFQYVMGYPYECEGDPLSCSAASSLVIKHQNTDVAAFNLWKDSVVSLNLSRYFRTGPNITKLEPLSHSSIDCIGYNKFKNLEEIIINPYKFGNGRNQYGEDWSVTNQEPGEAHTYLGFYMGEYLYKDLFEYLYAPAINSPLKTLIAKDSSIPNDSNQWGMEYFKTCCNGNDRDLIESLTHLDLSGNKLYMIDANWTEHQGTYPWGTGVAGLEYINLSDNLLGSPSSAEGGRWLDDDSFPSYDYMNGVSHFNKLYTFPPSCRYANFSKNPHLAVTDGIAGDGLQYFDCSNTSQGTPSGAGTVIDTPSIKEIHMSMCPLHGPNMLNEQGLIFHRAGNLRLLNLNNSDPKFIRNTVSSTDYPECTVFSHLEEINIEGNSKINSLNLRFHSVGDDVNWIIRPYPLSEEDAFGIPSSSNDFGNASPRLKNIYANNCTSLKRLYLPTPTLMLENGESDCKIYDDNLTLVDAEWTKEYLSKVEVSFCGLGIITLGQTKSSMIEFLSQDAFKPDNYPEGHQLWVDCTNNKDSVTGDPVTTELSWISSKIKEWTDTGRNLYINIDVE